jgi:cardiolipin synthase
VNEEAMDVVVDLARRLPAGDVARLSTAVSLGTSALEDLRSYVAGTALREACGRLLDIRELEPTWLAGALAGAAATIRRSDAAQVVEVVWSGPTSDVDTSRLTAPAIIDIIEEAKRELLVVSYATHDQPQIAGALHAAAARGVDITLLLERNADNPSYTALKEAFPGLDARRWSWSSTTRPPGASLHAKLVIVDDHTAVVGSANLTGRAMDANLECGVLIRGGPQPRAIRNHLWSLFQAGVITAVK